jgi:YidC/Oxa1 family membrane protein insertase
LVQVIGILAMPLGWIMRIGYQLTGSYGLAILFFAVVAKVITFPLTLSMQKNSIRLLEIQPMLEHIRRAHYGDKARINEEQYLLYKQQKYSPLSGLIPLFIQFLLLFGMVNVIYNPTRHIPELLDYLFLGIDLSVAQTKFPSIIVFPFLSGLSNYALCLVQNRLNPAQRRMRFWSKWGMSLIMIAFSIYFPLVTPGGIGLYWLYSNSLGIAAAFIANAMYPAQKFVSADLLKPPPKISHDELVKARKLHKHQHVIEQAALERFYSHPDKHKLMFYAVSGGQFKYYSEIIEYILNNTDIIVHYVTNDPNDKLLENSSERLQAYYVGEKKAITFMMNLRTVAMVVMTVPNLQQFHIKRSVVDTDIEYVYTWHHFTSLIMLREGAVDHFDTVFCVGPHQIEEIRKTEQFYNLRKKQLVKTGYGQMDMLMRLHTEKFNKNSLPQILIAPSWATNGLFDSCLDEIVRQLSDCPYQLVIRPHPEYCKRFPDKWNNIVKRYNDHAIIDSDFSSQDSIYKSDALVTDWSNIAYEFAFCTKRPVIFINTPQKIMNSEYKKLGIEPLDKILRSEIGENIDIDKLHNLPEILVDMLTNGERYRDSIEQAIDKWLFYPGRSGEAGGRYIINRLTNATVGIYLLAQGVKSVNALNS